MQAVITIIVFIVLLSVIVLIHEFGHFYTAIKFGIKAEEFGWGFPPKIWGKKIGKTLFTINLFPIGGFVRLKGEDSSAKEKDDPDSFASQHPWKKAVVIAAGILLNFVLAIVIFQLLIMMSSFKLSAQDTPFDFEYKFVNRGSDLITSSLNEVGEISEESQVNRLIAINGVKVSNIEDYEISLKSNSLESIVKIQFEELQNGNKIFQEGQLITQVVISQVVEDSIAQKAGLEKDDVIVSVNDIAVNSIGELQTEIRASEGKEVNVGYLEPDRTEMSLISVKPEFNEDLENYAIGISMFQENTLTDAAGMKYSFLIFENPTLLFDSPIQKAFAGAILAENMIELQVKGLSSIISTSLRTNDLKPIQESVAGPLGIVGITSFAVEQGVFSVLMLAGTLSLIIGVFNLLPIPALDGGRLFFVLIELISRRKVNAQFEKAVHTAGFAILILLILLITYNDITRFLREGSLFVFPDF